MIDFDKIFNEAEGDTSGAVDTREERLLREDKDLFHNKRLHEVKATMSIQTTSRYEVDGRVYRATTKGPGGKEESIGLVFKGQRLNDLKNGELLQGMEHEAVGLSNPSEEVDPKREIDVIGAWKPRSWKDSSGKSHKAFDLVVASWSHTSKTGQKVTEGAIPTVAAPSREAAREAAVREKADRRAQAKPQSRAIDQDELDF